MEPDDENALAPEAEEADADANASPRSRRQMAVTLGRCLKLVVGAARRETAALTLLNIAQGVGPALSLYLTKVVVDAVVRLGSLPVGAPTGFHILLYSAFRALLPAILGFIGVEIMMDTVETLGGFVSATMSGKLDKEVHHALLTKISSHNDISLFENPRLLNRVYLAQTGVSHLSMLTLHIENVAVGLFSFVPIFLLGLSIAWWVPFVIFLTSLPGIYVQGRLEEASWDLEETQAETMRAKGIQESFLSKAHFAREVRLLGLQPLFLGRWNELYGGALKQSQALRRRGASAILAWSLLSGAGIAVAYVYVVVETVAHRRAVGDLAVFTGLIFQVRHIWYVLLTHGASLLTLSLQTRPLFDLLELKATIKSGTVSADAPPTGGYAEQDGRSKSGSPNERAERSKQPEQGQSEQSEQPEQSESSGRQGALIEFKDVSFRYADTMPDALTGLNLRIEAGQTVAIVGENGAGKTTLAKLVGRLYDPTHGQILWDGSDLRSLDLDNLRGRIATVGQDFARFTATLRENIAFGWLPSRERDEELRRIVREVGLQSLLESGRKEKGGGNGPEQKNGLDMLIGAQLEGGTNLSGGQWQRVAIARAAVRKPQARLMILDEPTASLDPRTEYEILALLQRLSDGCTTLIITHRLSLARICDRIVVLERGCVVESGTHEELMADAGVYSEMFLRQASSYLDGATDPSAKLIPSA